MTRHEIHQLALRAAAKVTARLRRHSANAAVGLALSAAALGCGSSTGTAVGADTAVTAKSDTALDIAAWLDTYVAGNDLPTATEDTAMPDMAMPEDVAAIEDVATPEDIAAPEDVATADDAGAADATATDDSFSFADAGDGLVTCQNGDETMDWECCEAQQWQPTPQCTPWGPPAPPEYHGERIA